MSGEPAHKCPAPACALQIPFGMLACPQHWRMLPPRLKAAVSKAWRRGSWGEHSDARRVAVEWWARNS